MVSNEVTQRRRAGVAPASRRPDKRRRLKPEERRRELLDAAVELLRDRDADDVRVDDVTRAAGAAKGTFYLYFASWKDFLVAVREHYLATHASEIRSRVRGSLTEESADPWGAFEEECVRFVDLVVDLGNLHDVLFHGPMANEPTNPANSGETVAGEIIRMAIDAGVCREVDVEAAATLLFWVLHATADQGMRSGQRERRIEALLDLLRGWLRKPGERPCGREAIALPARGAPDA